MGIYHLLMIFFNFVNKMSLKNKFIRIKVTKEIVLKMMNSNRRSYLFKIFRKIKIRL